MNLNVDNTGKTSYDAPGASINYTASVNPNVNANTNINYNANVNYSNPSPNMNADFNQQPQQNIQISNSVQQPNYGQNPQYINANYQTNQPYYPQMKVNAQYPMMQQMPQTFVVQGGTTYGGYGAGYGGYNPYGFGGAYNAYGGNGGSGVAVVQNGMGGVTLVNYSIRPYVCGRPVPKIEPCAAIAVLVLNIFFPGFGTMIVGCLPVKDQVNFVSDCCFFYWLGNFHLVFALSCVGWIFAIVLGVQLMTVANMPDEPPAVIVV